MIPIGFCLATFGVPYRSIRTATQLIEQLGFDSVWLWDHYVSWNSPTESVLDGLSSLAALAEATSRIKLGPLVANNTNRHPARLAKIAATLQEISGGRFELGLGAGGLEYEQAPFGILQGDQHERFGRLREATEIIPALWRGAPVTYTGSYYQLDAAICSPAPDPHPPLILGALGPGIARLAGRNADGINIHSRARTRLPELFGALDAGLAERGRTRTNFDCSYHPSLTELLHDPRGKLAEWQQLGFNRVIAHVAAPFPLGQFEELAAMLKL